MRAHRENFPIWRESRLLVRRRIHRESLRFTAADRHSPDIVVRIHHLFIFAVTIGDERNRSAVCGKADPGIFIEMRRRIEVAGRNVFCFAAVEIGDKDVMPDIGAPFIPMPVGQGR